MDYQDSVDPGSPLQPPDVTVLILRVSGQHRLITRFLRRVKLPKLMFSLPAVWPDSTH